ncbi:hypothetical protein ACROYT_G029377 [Oculina patagonica]
MVAGRHSHTVQKTRNVTEVQWNYGTVARWNSTSVMLSRRHSRTEQKRYNVTVEVWDSGTEKWWNRGRMDAKCYSGTMGDQNSGTETVEQSNDGTLAQRHSAKIDQHSTGNHTESGIVAQRNSGTDA